MTWHDGVTRTEIGNRQVSGANNFTTRYGSANKVANYGLTILNGAKLLDIIVYCGHARAVDNHYIYIYTYIQCWLYNAGPRLIKGYGVKMAPSGNRSFTDCKLEKQRRIGGSARSLGRWYLVVDLP